MIRVQTFNIEQLITQMKEGRVRTLGRTDAAHPFSFFWTASGMEFTARAREVWADVESIYGECEIWMDVVVDGAPVQRIMLPEGKSRICLFRVPDMDTARTYQILRDTQAMPDDAVSVLRIEGISLVGSESEETDSHKTLQETIVSDSYEADGRGDTENIDNSDLSDSGDNDSLPELCQLPEHRCRIEFIGDSITSGEGVCGAVQEQTWAPFIYNAVESYPFLTAKALDAEIHVLSQSGWGVWCDWKGDRENALPLYYEQVCGVLGRVEDNAVGTASEPEWVRKINITEGCMRPWNFSSWQPDAVVINLGTNDLGAMDRVASGEITLERAKLITGENVGNSNAAIEVMGVRFRESAVSFLRQVRKCNPDAVMVWAYGMLGHGLEKDIMKALEIYKSDSGDVKVFYLRLPDTREGQFGSRQHPGRKTHEAAAVELGKILIQVLPGLVS